MNHAFKSSIGLMNYQSLRNQIKVLRKPRVNRYSQPSTEYLDALIELAITIKDTNNIVGLVQTNIRTDDEEYERGVYYHPYQFVIAEMNDGVMVSICLVLGDGTDGMDTTFLAPLVEVDANGKSLARGIIGQSRHVVTTGDDDLDLWKTAQ